MCSTEDYECVGIFGDVPENQNDRCLCKDGYETRHKIRINDEAVASSRLSIRRALIATPNNGAIVILTRLEALVVVR